MPVYKSKSRGKWYARVNYIDSNGTYRSKQSKYYDTKREALQAEADLMAKPIVTTSNMTFADAYAEYMKYQKDKVKISVYTKYPEMWVYVADLLGPRRIATLTVQQYNGFKEALNEMTYKKESMKDKKLSTDRKNKVHKFVLSLISFTKKMYDVSTNVPERCGGFSDPNAQQKEMKFYTYDQWKKYVVVLEEIAPLDIQAFFKTIYFCGLRKGECLALTWDDIDFEKQTISISKTILTKIKGEKYIITAPKTKSSNRIIPIPNEVLGVLRQIHDRDEQFTNFSKNWFVFGATSPISETTVANWNEKVAVSAELEKIRIHDFRHSFASLMANIGVPITVLSKMMGHSNIDITLKTYTHMYPNEMNPAVERLNKFVSGI